MGCLMFLALQSYREGVDEKRLRFSSAFGVQEDVAKYIWRTVLKKHHGIKPVHMLWALMFLKLYEPEAAAIQRWKTNRTTYRKYVWIVVNLIALQKTKKVRW